MILVLLRHDMALCIAIYYEWFASFVCVCVTSEHYLFYQNVQMFVLFRRIFRFKQTESEIKNINKTYQYQSR